MFQLRWRWNCNQYPKKPIYTTQNLGPDPWKRWYRSHNLAFYTDYNLPRVGQKSGLRTKFEELRLRLYKFWSPGLFLMGLRYSACDQRNYCASWRENQETGPDPFFFLWVVGWGGIDIYGPKPEKKSRFRDQLKKHNTLSLHRSDKNVYGHLSWRVRTQFFSHVNRLSEEFPINRASLWNPSSTAETETSLCTFFFFTQASNDVGLRKFKIQSLGNTVFLE